MPSTSELVRPPWLSFLLEPSHAALEQARAALLDLERELLQLTPETFSRLKTGPQKDPTPETHPDDAAWLAQELVKIAGLKSRELADLRSTLRAELGEEALESLEAGEEVETILRESGKPSIAIPGLQSLSLRLQGLIGEEE